MKKLTKAGVFSLMMATIGVSCKKQDSSDNLYPSPSANLSGINSQGRVPFSSEALAQDANYTQLVKNLAIIAQVVEHGYNRLSKAEQKELDAYAIANDQLSVNKFLQFKKIINAEKYQSWYFSSINKLSNSYLVGRMNADQLATQLTQTAGQINNNTTVVFKTIPPDPGWGDGDNGGNNNGDNGGENGDEPIADNPTAGSSGGGEVPDAPMSPLIKCILIDLGVGAGEAMYCGIKAGVITPKELAQCLQENGIPTTVSAVLTDVVKCRAGADTNPQ